jgi:hypothetical protein
MGFEECKTLRRPGFLLPCFHISWHYESVQSLNKNDKTFLLMKVLTRPESVAVFLKCNRFIKRIALLELFHVAELQERILPINVFKDEEKEVW